MLCDHICFSSDLASNSYALLYYFFYLLSVSLPPAKDEISVPTAIVHIQLVYIEDDYVQYNINN